MNEDSFLQYWEHRRSNNKWLYLFGTSILYGLILTVFLSILRDDYQSNGVFLYKDISLRFIALTLGWFGFKLFKWNKMEKTYQRILSEKK